MTAAKRYMLIINNKKFSNPDKYKERKGSDSDVGKLNKAFSCRGFDVKYAENKTAEVLFF